MMTQEGSGTKKSSRGVELSVRFAIEQGRICQMPVWAWRGRPACTLADSSSGRSKGMY
jgi:hypothetical protein